MKRIVSVLISFLILAMVLCGSVSAESTVNNTYTFETGDTHYTVEFFDNNLTKEQQKIVAEKLVMVEYDTNQTYGLGCTLFGHDYKYTTASVIRHKVRSSAPKCVKDMYDVTYCEDCDYTKQTLTGSINIYCCD